MADNLSNRFGNEISENAIKGMLDDEIKVHIKEDVVLPVIKLKLPLAESTVEIKNKGAQELKQKKAGSILSDLSAKSMVETVRENVIKLPDTLTPSQRMRKAFSMRRYGIPIRDAKSKPATPLPRVSAEQLKKKGWYRFRKAVLGAELLVPALLVFLLFSWMPIIKTFLISFHSYTSITVSEFVGLDNFVRILGDSKFWEALMHSSVLTLIVITLGTWIPFFLALYIYEMRRASGLVKVLYFIPFLTPAVPAAILWKWIYNQGWGLLNGFLSLFVPGDVTIGWLTDPNLVLFSIALVFIWKNTGWAILIYIAGLQNIPKNYFEGASLDGAGIAVKIKEIILPALKPVIMAVVFIQIISGMQVFTEVYIMTNGGPQGASEVIATYMYKKAFLYMDIGYAAGVALFFLFLLVSITLVRSGLSGRRA